MIKFFVLDIDGCLSYPFRLPHWPALTKIREWQQKSLQDKTIPALSLCTGRPFPYAEAVAQWLGIRNTIVFESGGGFYDPLSNKLTWSPYFTEEIAQKSKEIRLWLSKEVLPKYPGMLLEFMKKTDAGMIHNEEKEIVKVYEWAKEKIAEEYPEFEVHRTSVSVNIIVTACNKASGLQFFSEQEGVSREEIAFMGDSSGDIEALKWAGAPFAPSNADESVKKEAKVMKGESTEGVLEAYEMLMNSR